MNFLQWYLRYSFILIIASVIVFIITFFQAWMNNYQIIVAINDYHEATAELFLLLIGIPGIIYWVYNARDKWWIPT